MIRGAQGGHQWMCIVHVYMTVISFTSSGSNKLCGGATECQQPYTAKPIARYCNSVEHVEAVYFVYYYWGGCPPSQPPVPTPLELLRQLQSNVVMYERLRAMHIIGTANLYSSP